MSFGTFVLLVATIYYASKDTTAVFPLPYRIGLLILSTVLLVILTVGIATWIQGPRLFSNFSNLSDSAVTWVCITLVFWWGEGEAEKQKR